MTQPTEEDKLQLFAYNRETELIGEYVDRGVEAPARTVALPTVYAEQRRQDEEQALADWAEAMSQPCIHDYQDVYDKDCGTYMRNVLCQ